jgi:site-specific DNA recombinase
VPNRKVRFGADASPAGRVPAEPIEQMVLAQIHAALMSPEMVQSVWDVAREKYPALTEPEVVLPLRQMGQVWAQLFPAEQQRIVQLLVDRVTLREEGIEITWRDAGWHTLAGEMRPGTIGGNYWKWNSRRIVWRQTHCQVGGETPDPAESPRQHWRGGQKETPTDKGWVLELVVMERLELSTPGL